MMQKIKVWLSEFTTKSGITYILSIIGILFGQEISSQIGTVITSISATVGALAGLISMIKKES